MFFLLRMALWMSVVLVLLPSGGSQPHTATAPSAELGTMETLSAASATVSDMRQFCARQPEACAIGSQAAVAIGQRAQAGAKMVYDFITDQIAHGDTRAPASTRSAAVPVSNAAVPIAPGSQTTLRPDDLAPAWQGPAHAQPRRDQKPGV